MRWNPYKKRLNKIKDISEELQMLRKTNSAPESKFKLLEEIEERDQRKRNVILYGVREADETNIKEKQIKDRTTVDEILNKLGMDTENCVIHTTRLGKINSESTNPRPIKVVTKDANIAKVILRNSRKLPRGIQVNNDLTPLQREELKNLREQLVEKQKSNPNLVIRYIRGNPRIVNGKGNDNGQQRD